MLTFSSHWLHADETAQETSFTSTILRRNRRQINFNMQPLLNRLLSNATGLFDTLGRQMSRQLHSSTDGAGRAMNGVFNSLQENFKRFTSNLNISQLRPERLLAQIASLAKNAQWQSFAILCENVLNKKTVTKQCFIRYKSELSNKLTYSVDGSITALNQLSIQRIANYCKQVDFCFSLNGILLIESLVKDGCGLRMIKSLSINGFDCQKNTIVA